jgi:hypothetical protein
MMRVKLDGVKEFRRVLSKLDGAMLHILKEEVFAEAEAIMERSKSDFVPVKDGYLWTSGHVRPPKVKGTNVTVTLGYGGKASAYALAVHEGAGPQSWVGATISFQPHGDQYPKYLERPMMDARKGFPARLARSVKPRFERKARSMGAAAR